MSEKADRPLRRLIKGKKKFIALMLRQGSVARESLNQYQASDEGQSLDDCFPPQTSGQRPLAKIDSSSRETKSLFILFKFQVRMVQSVQMIDSTNVNLQFATALLILLFSAHQISGFQLTVNRKMVISLINFYPLVRILSLLYV